MSREDVAAQDVSNQHPSTASTRVSRKRMGASEHQPTRSCLSIGVLQSSRKARMMLDDRPRTRESVSGGTARREAHALLASLRAKVCRIEPHVPPLRRRPCLSSLLCRFPSRGLFRTDAFYGTREPSARTANSDRSPSPASSSWTADEPTLAPPFPLTNAVPCAIEQAASRTRISGARPHSVTVSGIWLLTVLALPLQGSHIECLATHEPRDARADAQTHASSLRQETP